MRNQTREGPNFAHRVRKAAVHVSDVPRRPGHPPRTGAAREEPRSVGTRRAGVNRRAVLRG